MTMQISSTCQPNLVTSERNIQTYEDTYLVLMVIYMLEQRPRDSEKLKTFHEVPTANSIGKQFTIDYWFLVLCTYGTIVH